MPDCHVIPGDKASARAAPASRQERQTPTLAQKHSLHTSRLLTEEYFKDMGHLQMHMQTPLALLKLPIQEKRNENIMAEQNKDVNTDISICSVTRQC